METFRYCIEYSISPLLFCQRYPVSTLPIRNGNYSKTQHYPYLLNNRQYLSTLPIRNGNFCACFLPFFITLVGNSEYLTYKEWKPFPPVGRFYMMPSCCNVSTLPIRNGNILSFSKTTVSTFFDL